MSPFLFVFGVISLVFFGILARGVATKNTGTLIISVTGLLLCCYGLYISWNYLQ